MKAKSIFVVLAAALCIGSITYSVINQKEPQPVSAEEYNAKTSVQNGLFVKVTDENTLVAGESYLLIGRNDQRLQHIVGASYHYWVTTEFGGDVKRFDDYIFCENAKGELVTLEDAGGGYFNLKLKHYVDNTEGYVSKVRSGYLVHEAYNNNGVTAFGDLYIREKKNKVSENAAKWSCTYTNNHMRIVSGTNRLLQWKSGSGYSWSSFIASTHTEWTSNVDLYRKVDISSVASTEVVRAASKTTYYYGETTVLTDLIMNVTFKSGEVITISYNDHPELFEALKVQFYPPAGCFKWCGIPLTYPATAVNHDTRNWRHYLRDNNHRYTDLRGSYLLGFVDNCYSEMWSETKDNTFVLKLSSLDGAHPGEVSELYYHQNPVCDGYAEPDAQYDGKFDNVVNNVVNITLESNKFYIKVGNYYLGTQGEGFLNKENERSGIIDFAITVDKNNHILFGNNTYMLVYDKRTTVYIDDPTRFQAEKMVLVNKDSLESYHIPVELYRLQLLDNLPEYNAYETFKGKFLKLTSKFDPLAFSKNVDRDDWNDLADDFDNLPLVVKGYLASMTYVHNEGATNSVEQMMDRYDSIVNTYYNKDGGYIDFMSRGLNLIGTLQTTRSVTINCTNCTVSGANTATYKSSYEATITSCADHYQNPAFVEVLMGGLPLELDSQYTYEDGVITINSNVIAEDIVINVVAEFTGYQITYNAGEGFGGNYFVGNISSGSSVDLLDFATTGFVVPLWKRFVGWRIGAMVYDPGDPIAVKGDVVATAVYEYEYYSVETVNNLDTIAALSYQYATDGLGNYTFNNVAIRFGGFISEDAWNALVADGLSIQGFGVMIYTDDLLDDKLDEKNAQYDLFVETDQRPTYASASVKTANNVDPNDNYYAWNLKANIAEGYYLLDITAVAYIKTSAGYIYFDQVTTSVKDLAATLLDKGYDFDGSLSYLANHNWGN